MNKIRYFTGRYINKILNLTLTRKNFSKVLGLGLSYLLLNSKSARRAFAKTTNQIGPRIKKDVITDYDIVVAKGEDASRITRAAVDNLGGMKKFVKKGDTVVVKPNIGWDRSPEQAGNTNPEVVKTLVEMCFESGAKIVKVFDNTCNDARRTYKSTGIYDAVKKAGGTIFYVSDWKFYPGKFPKNSLMEDWPIFRDAVKCDCFINVPIAKHHRLTKLTLSIKNLMGVCGGRRGTMHHDIHRKLVELAEFIKPDLTIIDAYRILLRNGPTGGSLSDVEKRKTVIASNDPVLADSYAATLFDLKPEDIGYIKLSARSGLGSMKINKANLKEIKV